MNQVVRSVQMDDFRKIAASNNSLANRKLIHGIGINDADYKTKIEKDGRGIRCPYYRRWSDMLRRCYSSKFHEKNPTYRDCTACKEWLTFSNFRKWMVQQDWQDRELDKDIISQGNKIYAPAYCRFISSQLNTLLVAHDAARGDLPLGIYWDKQKKKYKAQININGNQKNLGRFKTAQEAKAAYNKAKYAEIQRHAMMQTDPEIKAGLLKWRVE